MNAPAYLSDTQKVLLEMTQKYHQDAMNLLTEGLQEYAKETGKNPTNAMQFAAIDGFMAAAGQILGALTVDAITGKHLPADAAIDGGVGTVCMFQKTLLNVFASILEQGGVKVADLDKMVDDFEKAYKKEQKAKAN